MAAAFTAGWLMRERSNRGNLGPSEHDRTPVKTEDGEILYWTCTMHPSVKMAGPGKCPICSMDLVPVRKRPEAAESPERPAATTGQPPNPHQGHGRTIETPQETAAPTAVPGAPAQSTFTVDPKRQQMIGVRTEPIATRSLSSTITTIGRVDLDERRIVHVHTKFSGWISRVFVDFQWQHVRKGEPLFAIYSPELVSTQEEYLLALKANSTLGRNSLQEVAGGAHSLLQAARRRLELWDISDEQIDRLAETGEIQRDLIVYSPAEGHVTERKAFENTRIEPGTELYTIADHSVVWVYVEVYENDIPLVRLGQRAMMTIESFPGRRFAGHVAYIEPHVMEQTRTLRVRLEFANSDLTLKPGMYAEVTLDVPGPTVVAVPESAVLRTGERDIVFIDHDEGRLEVRQIQLGRRSDNYYEVLRGLRAGEKVVVSGNFLIDAESKVQGAIANWGGETRP
jgi:RND family efflux transporter MFP subunit